MLVAFAVPVISTPARSGALHGFAHCLEHRGLPERGRDARKH